MRANAAVANMQAQTEKNFCHLSVLLPVLESLDIKGSRANLPVREEASKQGITGAAAILRPSETYRDGIVPMDLISITMITIPYSA